MELRHQEFVSGPWTIGGTPFAIARMGIAKGYQVQRNGVHDAALTARLHSRYGSSELSERDVKDSIIRWLSEVHEREQPKRCVVEGTELSDLRRAFERFAGPLPGGMKLRVTVEEIR